MSHSSLTWKIFFAIILNDAADSFAQVLMKKGLFFEEADIWNIHALAGFLSHNVSSPFLWFGVAIYTANFFIWIAILSRIELSIAIPLSSTMYAIVPIFAVIFLHEVVSPLRWLGIVFIIAGIYVVSKSKRPVPANPGVV
ncbi:MAG: EamA family transporter [Candidatus Omnitrophota bacterium]|jgi:drug/metabolite transporter (DMT)-like permease